MKYLSYFIGGIGCGVLIYFAGLWVAIGVILVVASKELEFISREGK